jgi:hypothetical protein
MSDVVCLLCGLSTEGGPSGLINHNDLDAVSTTMASEILSYDPGRVSLSLEDLTSIVSNALQLTLPPVDTEWLYDRAPNFPEDISDENYEDTTIGIGHFNEGGICEPDEHGRYPSGRDIQVRRITDYSGNGAFWTVVVDDPDAKDGSGVRNELELSYCGLANTICNLCVCPGCLKRLRAWLDPSLPQRAAFLDHAPSMSLEGELYEIANSRHREIEGMNRKTYSNMKSYTPHDENFRSPRFSS